MDRTKVKCLLDRLHRFSNSRKHSSLNLVERTVEERSCSRLMTASTKFSGDAITIECTTTAEAELKASCKLLDKDDADFRSTDSQGQIDRIFGVRRKSSGFRKVLFEHMRVDKLAIKFRRGSRENTTSQSNTAKRVAFVKVRVI